MDAAATVTTYLRMGWRKKWWLLVPLVLCTTLSFVVLQYLPKTYRATTVILVEPQSIPSDYVKPLIETPKEGRLKTIRQQVTSRTRLEQAARDLQLYPATDDPVLEEQRIQGMRARIDLEVKADQSFAISYRHGDPVVAANVANRLADLFIESSARGRQEQAQHTQQFLSDELERERTRLAKQEAALAEFKRRYQAELPEQQNSNLRTLEGLERELRDNQLALERSRDRKVLLETQLSSVSPFDIIDAQVDPDDPRVQLARMRKELANLRLRYTEKYPDVRRLEGQIQAKEREVKSLPTEAGDVPGVLANPAYDRLRGEITAVELEIRGLLDKETRLREDIGRYRQRVENAPTREQELLSLTRDYETLKENYRSLLKKQTEAQLAESLERGSQGEQFIILDRALPPAIAFRPDPIQVIGAGVLLGLAIGIAIVGLHEVLSPTFYSPQQLQESLGVPVVAAVPFLRPDAKGRRAAGM